MPPLAPKRSPKTHPKAHKNASSSRPKKAHPSAPASNKVSVSSPPEGSDEECFLIPAAVPQEQPPQSTESPITETRKTNLRSLSSNLYCLPVGRKDQAESCIYISTRASFPDTSPTHPASTSTPAESDGRTLFVTNISRDTTVEDMKSLFSGALKVEVSDIEVVIQCPTDRSTETLRVNLIDRESSSIATTSTTKNKRSKKSTNDKSIPLLMPESALTLMKTIPTRLLPIAYVRFKTPEQLRQIIMIQPSSLPLQWPISQTKSACTKPMSWLARYREIRQAVRPSAEVVTAHADGWMNAFDAGLITPIATLIKEREPTNTSDEKAAQIATSTNDPEDDDGGGWTTVTRGGQHGRSSTIPTQHPTNGRSADPYAQSSMAGRDAGAAVKVMKRGFAQAFSREDGEVENAGKRHGGELNQGFYRVNVADSKKAKMNELKRKFDEDKARVERMKNSRKFRPY